MTVYSKNTKKIPKLNMEYHGQYVDRRKKWKGKINFFKKTLSCALLEAHGKLFDFRVSSLAHSKSNDHRSLPCASCSVVKLEQIGGGYIKLGHVWCKYGENLNMSTVFPYFVGC